jgi:hypothetical protein
MPSAEVGICRCRLNTDALQEYAVERRPTVSQKSSSYSGKKLVRRLMDTRGVKHVNWTDARLVHVRREHVISQIVTHHVSCYERQLSLPHSFQI